MNLGFNCICWLEYLLIPFPYFADSDLECRATHNKTETVNGPNGTNNLQNKFLKWNKFIIIIIQKICSAHISTLLGAQGANPETPGQAPLSFTISVLGSFTCITQHTGHTALGPIRRTKQLWLSVLLKNTSAATGLGRDSNLHSDNARTWVQCTRPLGHDTPLKTTPKKYTPQTVYYLFGSNIAYIYFLSERKHLFIFVAFLPYPGYGDSCLLSKQMKPPSWFSIKLKNRLKF